MSGWMDGVLDKMSVWMSGLMDSGQTNDGWMINSLQYKWEDGWMNGIADKMNELSDKWVDGCITE